MNQSTIKVYIIQYLFMYSVMSRNTLNNVQLIYSCSTYITCQFHTLLSCTYIYVQSKHHVKKSIPPPICHTYDITWLTERFCTKSDTHHFSITYGVLQRLPFYLYAPDFLKYPWFRFRFRSWMVDRPVIKVKYIL